MLISRNALIMATMELLYMTQMKPHLGLNTTISTEVSEKIIILKILKLSGISMIIRNL